LNRWFRVIDLIKYVGDSSVMALVVYFQVFNL